jgi:23S rRNA (adenine2503-C2)-methyltransferase
MIKTSLCGMTADEIQTLAGCDSSVSISISNSIYKKRIDDIYLFPGIPKRVKEELNNKSYPGLYKPAASQKSSDGTIKYLFRNEQGLEFETVYMQDNKRNTVCISSQSGCRMGCPFCVTGKSGFRGNLAVQDMINQIISLPEAGRVTHAVFMGMGEPMDNIDNVLKACNILSAEWGLAISRRNITVSTVGITSGVERFLERSECNLTLSLYSPFPEERYMAIPAEKKYPACEIIDIMKKYPAGRKRRMSVAYIMIRDINDTDRHLDGLRRLLKKSRIRINLLPYHSIPGDDNIPSSFARMQHFKHELVISGISASIRKSRGTDVSAACGLLASGLNQ